jgi:hypothetical protein
MITVNGLIQRETNTRDTEVKGEVLEMSEFNSGRFNKILPELDQAWHPLVSKMMVDLEEGGNRISIHVHPDFPLRWREEPYYSQIKKWSVFAADHQAQVVIYVKDRVTVVLPNKEIDLGEVEPEDHIMVGELDIPVGRDWNAYIRKAKDIPEDEREVWVTWAIRDMA